MELNALDIILAEAREKANKPPRTKKAAVLAALVEFFNEGEGVLTHFETRFPSKNASGINTLIKQNDALDGKLYAIDTEEYGLCIANLTVETQN